MVTIKCTIYDCANKNIEYNFLGNPNFVECGGCGEKLVGTDYRQDPEVLSTFMGDING
jgi:hypothetical protein